MGAKVWPCKLSTVKFQSSFCNATSEPRGCWFQAQRSWRWCQQRKKATGRGACSLSQLDASFSMAGWRVCLSHPACTQILKKQFLECLDSRFLSLILSMKSSNRNCVLFKITQDLKKDPNPQTNQNHTPW